MLVLSRKQNQTVVIDGQIEVEVLKIKGNTVRLGISAPNNVKVLRGELSPFEIELKTKDPENHSKTKYEVKPVGPLANGFSVVHAN